MGNDVYIWEMAQVFEKRLNYIDVWEGSKVCGKCLKYLTKGFATFELT